MPKSTSRSSKPQDIAGGHLTPCWCKGVRAGDATSCPRHPVAPASVQDQERPDLLSQRHAFVLTGVSPFCGECNCPESDPVHPPAPPIAKAGEPLPEWCIEAAGNVRAADDAMFATDYARLIHAAFLASPDWKVVKAAIYCATNHCDCDQSDIVRDGIIRAALAESADRGEEKANG